MRDNLKNTKEKIVEAAIVLFSQHGIHWVSFQQIATKVGIAQPTLYKHFQDKDDLILACAKLAATNGRQIIDHNVDPYHSASEQIKSYIEGNFLWIKKHPEEARVFFSIYYFSYNSVPIHEVLMQINTQSIERLSIRITAGQREGLWSSADVQIAARLIHDLLVGEIFKALHLSNEMTVDKRTDLVWLACEKILKN